MAAVYQDEPLAYGLDRLRSLSAKRHAWDRNTDGWEGTKILFRELWRGQPNLALPALGGLFAPGQVRDFSDCLQKSIEAPADTPVAAAEPVGGFSLALRALLDRLRRLFRRER